MSFQRHLGFGSALVDVLTDEMPPAEVERIVALAKARQRELATKAPEVVVLRARRAGVVPS